MRYMKVSLLAAVLLAFGTMSASATTVTLGGADGQLVGVTDTVSITVTLDAEANLTLVGVGVLFDDTILAFNSGATTSASYIFYSGGKPAYLGRAGLPELRFGTTNQVNLNFTSSDLLTLQNGANVGGVALMATLIFDVIALGDGQADITPTVAAAGNAIQQCTAPGSPQFGVGSQPCTAFVSLAGGATLVSNTAGYVITPEPTTALLVGLGLAGLAVAGRRRE
jgi:hypothetical protein